MAKSTVEDRTMIKGYQKMQGKINLGVPREKMGGTKFKIDDKVTVHKAK